MVIQILNNKLEMHQLFSKIILLKIFYEKDILSFGFLCVFKIDYINHLFFFLLRH